MIGLGLAVALGGWGAALLASDAPPAGAATRMDRDLQWLVEELGPRPSGSAQEQRAAAGVRTRLEALGWSVHEVGLAGNQVACRGAPERLFLAHVDTVPGAPGAIDNGAAVSVLLELARDPALGDLCVGFPVQEELGLVGARVLARAAAAGTVPFGEGLPRLVVSMELVGQGRLALMGLGPQWGDGRLRWLADAVEPLPRVPLPYRVYSRLLPWAERSDHGPFGALGVPSLLLLGQGPGEVYPRYHQPTDTQWDQEALVQALAVVRQLAQAPLPPDEGPPVPWTESPSALGAGAFIGSWLLPSWLVTTLTALAVLSGLIALRRPDSLRELPRQLATGLGGALVGGMLMAGAAASGVFPVGLGEAAAQATLGVSPTGWWTAAPVATVLGLGGLLGTRWAAGARGSAPLGGAMCTTLAWLVDPVLALPFAVGALLSRLHPALALLPVLILLRPDALRQLGFHGLLPPMAWGLVLVVGWPAAGRGPRRRAGRGEPKGS